MPVCRTCHVEKPQDGFSLRTDTGRYRTECKQCRTEKRVAFYKTPHGRKKKQESAWREHGIEMTVELYEKMLAAQGGVCAICGVERNRNGSRLCVDHHHESGTVRGILCHHCNTVLGKMNDDVFLLLKAIDYLLERSPMTVPSAFDEAVSR